MITLFDVSQTLPEPSDNARMRLLKLRFLKDLFNRFFQKYPSNPLIEDAVFRLLNDLLDEASYKHHVEYWRSRD